ncbi:hypothetical protein GPALN_010622 [Globodera pallida]|nr:hypothetical protein GPALN_010622 [Globodera pallida]
MQRRETSHSREQLPKECTDASGCKASVALARFQRRGCHFYDALVFEVDLFAFQEAYQKCTWRAYINETRLLLDKDATNGYWTWTIAVAKLALFFEWSIIIYCAFKPPAQPPAQFPRSGRLQDCFHE